MYNSYMLVHMHPHKGNSSWPPTQNRKRNACRQCRPNLHVLQLLESCYRASRSCTVQLVCLQIAAPAGRPAIFRTMCCTSAFTLPAVLYSILNSVFTAPEAASEPCARYEGAKPQKWLQLTAINEERYVHHDVGSCVTSYVQLHQDSNPPQGMQ